jgi:hypothetical protein
MRASLLQTFLAVLIALSAAASSPAASAEAAPAARGETARIVDYIFSLFMIRQRMASEVKRQAANEPEVQELMLQVYQRDDVVAKLSDGFSPLVAIPPESVSYCLAFIDSEAGKAALGVAARLESNSQLMAELQKLPPAQLQPLGAYLNSPCTQAPIAAMSSEAGQALSLKLGAEMVCDYVREARPDRLDFMKKHGKCTDATAK